MVKLIIFTSLPKNRKFIGLAPIHTLELDWIGLGRVLG
jgi:hypothetical protein